jgi:molybdopterin converting factor small subunit
MIQVSVQLVGPAAELAGETNLDYALTPPARLGTLLEMMTLRRPALAARLDACRIAVNDRPAGPATLLSDGDRVRVELDEP